MLETISGPTARTAASGRAAGSGRYGRRPDGDGRDRPGRCTRPAASGTSQEDRPERGAVCTSRRCPAGPLRSRHGRRSPRYGRSRRARSTSRTGPRNWRLMSTDVAGVRHGISGYRRGCPCHVCRTANAGRVARNRARRRADPSRLAHGTISAYGAGCRCQPCRDERKIQYMTREGGYRPNTWRELRRGARAALLARPDRVA